MSDSVTGSPEEQPDYADYIAYYAKKEAIYDAIRRDAVDAFIRDELPELLAEAMIATGWMPRTAMNKDGAGKAIAAKVAELRDE